MASLSPTAARYLLTLLKGRELVLMDEQNAYSPFPYDKKFFDRLRRDQVPRFLRCLTTPEKLPKRWVQLDKLSAVQDRVALHVLERVRAFGMGMPPTVVRTEDTDYIIDGLHRSTIDWLDGVNEVVVHYCDLSDRTEAVEPVQHVGPERML